MSCETCGEKGLVLLDWADAPPDYGICLCPAGAWYRSDLNAGKHTGTFGWQVWCAKHQVDPSRVVRLEDVLTAEELAACGFGGSAKPLDREAALLATGKKRKSKL